jgi:hypothetical protein
MCEERARDKAQEAEGKLQMHDMLKPVAGAFAGLISGAIIGCVTPIEAGCVEVAIPAAATAAFGGLILGSANAIYSDTTGTINILKKMNQDIATCSNGGS